MALAHEVDGIGAVVGRNYLIAFLFQKHDMGLQEINLVVGPKDCGFVHSLSNLYGKRKRRQIFSDPMHFTEKFYFRKTKTLMFAAEKVVGARKIVPPLQTKRKSSTTPFTASSASLTNCISTSSNTLISSGLGASNRSA